MNENPQSNTVWEDKFRFVCRTRDEWDHLLRLLNIMNFSMFHWSHFLSNRKQSMMSERDQESRAKEGSAVAKPKPMSLVSRNLPSAKQTSPNDLGASNGPGNHELDQTSVSWSARKLVRDISTRLEDQSIDLGIMFVELRRA